MRRLICIIVFMAVAAFFCGCVKYDVDEILLERDDLSLTWKGVEQLSYDPLTWQIGCNVGRGEYRVHDDNMANYYIVRCKDRPVSEGQDIYADIEWTVWNNIKRYEGVRLTVMKMDGDGKIWLWSKVQKIGVVVKEI